MEYGHWLHQQEEIEFLESEMRRLMHAVFTQYGYDKAIALANLEDVMEELYAVNPGHRYNHYTGEKV